MKSGAGGPSYREAKGGDFDYPTLTSAGGPSCSAVWC